MTARATLSGHMRAGKSRHAGADTGIFGSTPRHRDVSAGTRLASHRLCKKPSRDQLRKEHHAQPHLHHPDRRRHRTRGRRLDLVRARLLEMSLAPDDPRHGTLTGYGRSHRCRCNLCKAARAAYQREWIEKNKRNPLSTDSRHHGTAYGYGQRACRCEACRAAWNQDCKERSWKSGRRRPRAEYLADVRANPPPHGTESRYTARRCRCAECKEASRLARARRRAAAA